MAKSLLVSTVGLLLSTAMFAVGTYAFLTDPGASEANFFDATTVDLHLNGTESVTGTLSDPDWSPGDTLAGSLLLAQAAGGNPLPDAGLDLDFTGVTVVTECPGPPSCSGAVPGAFDADANVTALTYGAANLLATLCWDNDGNGIPDTTAPADVNTNGRVDLEDLSATSCIDLPSPGVAGTVWAMALQFVTDPDFGDEGDSLEITLTFQLSQVGAPDLGPSVLEETP